MRLSLSICVSLLCACLFAFGCSKPPEKAILGTWTLNDEKTVPILGTGENRSANIVAVGMMTHTYTFNEDNSVVVAYQYGMDSWERRGTWSVGNLDGNRQYYRIEPPDGETSWSGFSVNLVGKELNAKLPNMDDEAGVFTR